MAVISLSITESLEQIVSGFPAFVSVSTNIPATIFYSLDGTTPTLFSTIYISPIAIPTDKTSVVLSIFASNGTDTSPVLVETYQTDTLCQNARTPHSGTNAPANSTQATIDPAPFGSPPIYPNQKFLGAAEAGLTVFNPLLPAGDPTGFDANGNPTGFTNNQEKALPTKHFPFIFSDTNAEGEQGNGIGNLPRSSIIPSRPPPERTDINSRFFDPRASVIIQDLTKPVDPGLPPHINRMSYTLDDLQKDRDGANYYTTGQDASPTTGGFVRREYNATNNTMTYYYFDNSRQKWIISTVSYTPAADQFNYAGSMVIGKNGLNRVYQWVQFKANYLY